ncbi:MAG TPA: hypothetical protein G4N94_06135 [Caldilineae bacterium]|nr:hypothetical protein [Caldilineae bacterium]
MTQKERPHLYSHPEKGKSHLEYRNLGRSGLKISGISLAEDVLAEIETILA